MLGVSHSPGGRNRQAGHRIFRAVKTLCTLLYWWIRVIPYLSKPMEHSDPDGIVTNSHIVTSVQEPQPRTRGIDNRG